MARLNVDDGTGGGTGGGGGGATSQSVYYDCNWTRTAGSPSTLVTNLEVVLHTGSDPTVLSAWIGNPVLLAPTETRAILYQTYPAGTTPPSVKFSIREIFPWGKGAWTTNASIVTPTLANIQSESNDNLMPNPTSEYGGNSQGIYGYAAALVVNEPSNAYVGSWCRKLDASATNQTALTPIFPCSYGDQVSFDAMIKTSNATVSGRLVVKFYDSAGSVVGTGYSSTVTSTTYTSTNQTSAFRASAPATAVSFQAFVETVTTGASQYIYFDSLNLRRAITSKVMGADEGFRVINSHKNSGNTTTDVIWPTVNNDPNVNGGAPVLLDPAWNPQGVTRKVGDRVVGGYTGAVGQAYALSPYVYECTTGGTEMLGADYSTIAGGVAAWSSATTYSTGNIVTYTLGGQTHGVKSLQNSNLNHTPTLGGDSWWQDLGCIYGPVGTDPAADSATSGIGNAVKWKCVGWMWTTGATPGCRPWVRSTAYAVGDLVCGDPGSTNAGYTATYDKLYGQPEGPRFNPSGTLSNYGGTKIYRCTTAGTSSASGNGPTGTGTSIADGAGALVWAYFGENTGPEERLQIWHLNTMSDATTYGQYQYEFRIQPKTNRDNLDAITHVSVEIVKGSDNTTWQRANTWTHAPLTMVMPSRKYFSPGTPNLIANMSRATFNTGMIPMVAYNGASPYAAAIKLRVRLHNSSGVSDAVDYYLWNSTNSQPAPYSAGYTGTFGTPPSGGGGSGGGGCPAPETLVDVWADGVFTQKMAGDLQVGDLLVTYHASTDTYGLWPALKVERLEDQERWKVDFTDGFSTVVSKYHRYFRVDGTQVETCHMRPGDLIDGDHPREVAQAVEFDLGPVMAISVDQAHTYQTSGLLQSNIKP